MTGFLLTFFFGKDLLYLKVAECGPSQLAQGACVGFGIAQESVLLFPPHCTHLGFCRFIMPKIFMYSISVMFYVALFFSDLDNCVNINISGMHILFLQTNVIEYFTFFIR